MPEHTPTQSHSAIASTGERGANVLDFIRLARPVQWAKGMFVLVGPAYFIATLGITKIAPADLRQIALAALGAFLAFGLASSGCYIVNDIRDRVADQSHPRKRNRPIASGRISPGVAMAYAGVLWALAACCVAFLVPATTTYSVWLLGACVLAYVLNVIAYSIRIKHAVVADTISLAIGFVLRVLGGCAAAGVEPSSWLLNVTFFLSMFLALGKRLGERRTMGDDAATARAVQLKYTDSLLRMGVVVTAVATLLSYSDYVQAQHLRFTLGFNLLWLTMLPATYGMLRCIVLVERGVFDDPTELATKDRPFQLAALAFVVLTAILMVGAARGWFINPNSGAQLRIME